MKLQNYHNSGLPRSLGPCWAPKCHQKAQFIFPAVTCEIMGLREYVGDNPLNPGDYRYFSCFPCIFPMVRWQSEEFLHYFGWHPHINDDISKHTNMYSLYRFQPGSIFWLIFLICLDTARQKKTCWHMLYRSSKTSENQFWCQCLDRAGMA
jgi:hypothetical protein